MPIRMPSFQISASGLEAQRLRMDLTSANLANAQTTRGPDGGPYQKLRPIFEVDPVEKNKVFTDNIDDELVQVKFKEVYKDQSAPKRVYDPQHPDANKAGYVEYPNINLMEEMADLLLASRAYEANVTAFNTSKAMAMGALNIGKL